MGNEMSLARDLVELEEKLRERNIDFFVPVDKGGLDNSAETISIVGHLESLGFDNPL